MINKLTFLLLLICTNCYNQQLYLSSPFQVSSPSTGNTHPRVALVNEKPIIVWGDPSNNDNLMYSIFGGITFLAPVQLTYNDEMVMLGYAEGAVIKTFGDSVYICYVSVGLNENRIYLRKSIDGGQSFSDTILVNDRSNGVEIEYANMTLDETGNPLIVFINNETSQNPKYVFYRSTDGGNSFISEINATPDVNSQPCECCPSSILVENNLIYHTYRNNISNIRDFYVSISDNGGISFDSLRRIDYTNWFSNTCPASGTSSMLSADSLISVFMVKENGQSMIKAGLMHKSDFMPGNGYYVDPSVLSSSFNMNYPEMAGNGDTIGIVWQDNRSGYNKIYISYSLTGMDDLSAPLLISDFAGNVHQNPHLVFSKGVFHITWKDYNNDLIWYRKAAFSVGDLGISALDKNEIKIYPNPANSYFCLGNTNNAFVNLDIFDVTGNLVFSSPVQPSEKINTEGFAPGVYQIRISSDSYFHSEKLLIQR